MNVNTSAAWIYLFLKDYEASLRQARGTLELFPTRFRHTMSSAAPSLLYPISRPPSRLSRGHTPFPRMPFQQAIWRTRMEERAKSKPQSLCATHCSRDSRSEYVPMRALYCMYAGLGERDLAFEWLEKGYRHHDPMSFWLRVCPTSEPLRSDPRFEEIARPARTAAPLTHG